ncbi:hypothetical protein HMPREF3193_00267 [Bifidobacterium breve]|nr:hypothetical protein HMPREF1587_01253 [Bifidobacterium breve JCP7499]KWZ86561.1 hypothetical protein HMPREF3193_00267 [Bifidobacterium breve]
MMFSLHPRRNRPRPRLVISIVSAFKQSGRHRTHMCTTVHYVCMLASYKRCAASNQYAAAMA